MKHKLTSKDATLQIGLLLSSERFVANLYSSLFFTQQSVCWRCCVSRIGWFSAALQWNKPNGTTSHHVVMLLMQLQTSRSEFNALPILSYPPGDDSCFFHDKVASQIFFSKDKLLTWHHKMMMEGVNGGVFTGGCGMSECRMDKMPHFLVSGEERDNRMIERTP